MTFSEADRLELLRALTHEAPRFGGALASTAYSRGLAVTHPDGTTRPISITATPIIIEHEELQRRQGLAALISSATLKMSRAVLLGPRRALVLDALSPLERRLVQGSFEALTTLATTRVDFFVGETVSALEVNATIPAMQGYSDIAAHTYLEVVGRAFGVNDSVIARWQARNGSNALALYRALLSGYQRFRPGQWPKAIALLCRRNDAQLTEVRALCERFRDWGSEADVVFPDELEGDDGKAVKAHGKKYDLVYRHLFVRRLEEPGCQGAGAVERLLAETNGTRAVVLNPPATQVEVKAVFALLSQALEDSCLAEEAGLSQQELEAIAQAVPWTRVFQGDALVAQVAADPERYVLKRSWDYGGRAVFVGATCRDASFAERVTSAYSEPLDWNQLCARAVQDTRGGGFVVQELVKVTPQTHVLCEGDTQRTVPLFVDFSAYASVGIEATPAWGGVCRGSASPIVNIVGGGGVLPLLTSENAQSLLAAWRACVM